MTHPQRTELHLTGGRKLLARQSLDDVQSALDRAERELVVTLPRGDRLYIPREEVESIVERDVLPEDEPLGRIPSVAADVDHRLRWNDERAGEVWRERREQEREDAPLVNIVLDSGEELVVRDDYEDVWRGIVVGEVDDEEPWAELQTVDGRRVCVKRAAVAAFGEEPPPSRVEAMIQAAEHEREEMQERLRAAQKDIADGLNRQTARDRIVAREGIDPWHGSVEETEEQLVKLRGPAAGIAAWTSRQTGAVELVDHQEEDAVVTAWRSAAACPCGFSTSEVESFSVAERKVAHEDVRIQIEQHAERCETARSCLDGVDP